MRVASRLFLLAVALATCVAPSLAATPVAVFNFQMKSETPDWKWLEKGLADRIATDCVQDRGLTVVARDEMQLVAQKMAWVPEMAITDATAAGTIRAQLKIDTLVTGVYSVEGDQIRLTGQIIDVSTRKEVARKEIEGRAQDVLELQRQLSAELLSVLVEKPAAGILASLPVWTRSLPATKALYEGMDLYDQGRYAEGWLKFRQASKADPGYMEAQYWVGKMYYFMNRYEHARRAIERFVYLDMVHPRVGDAMVEYVHTYERQKVSPETLLKLYETLSARYAEAKVWEGGWFGRFGTATAGEWLRAKTAQLLGTVGRCKEAAILTRPAMDDAEGHLSGHGACMVNVLRHHSLTAEALEPQVLMKTEWARVGPTMLSFDARGTPRTYTLPEPRRLVGREYADTDKAAAFDKEEESISLFLSAPSAYVFKAIRFYPLTDGNDGAVDCSVYVPGTYAGVIEHAPPKTEPLRTARVQGVALEGVPRLGMLLAKCRIRVKDSKSGALVVTGVRVAAEMTRMPSPGTIDVVCRNTPHFRVEVDGVFARWLPGLVGPLAAGEHVVRLCPLGAVSPYAEQTAKVLVQPGKATQAVFHLPWRADGPFAAWITTQVGRDYPAGMLRIYRPTSSPAVQADEGAIRMVWPYDGDLWSAVSNDGQAFSPPQKLELPVSSGWVETAPRLVRDESGRFVLTFLSDRNAQHRQMQYVTWSRDFVHWSAPALVYDEAVYRPYDLIMDKHGRLLTARPTLKAVKVLASADGNRWEELSAVPSGGGIWIVNDVGILQRRDGRLDLFTVEDTFGSGSEGNKVSLNRLVRHTSDDGRTWSKSEVIAEFPSKQGVNRLACSHVDGRSVVLGYKSDTLYLDWWLAAFAEQADGTWKKSGFVCGAPPGYASMEFHPRWGWLIAALMPEGHEWFPHSAYGPFLMRGPSIEPLLKVPPTPIQVQAPRQPQGANPQRITITGPDGRVQLVQVQDGAPTAVPPGAPKPRPDAPVGELTIVPSAGFGLRRKVTTVEGRANFRKALPGSGTVNPNAVVVTVRRDSLVVDVAIDSVQAGSQHFDVLRIDPTAKGDFRNAAVVPRALMAYEADPKRYRYSFTHPAVELKFPERTVWAEINSIFNDGEADRSFSIRLSTYAEGKCQFGDKSHMVRIYDGNCNLRHNDTTDLATARGGDAGIGDSFFVDLGDGTFAYKAAAFYGHPVLVDGSWWNLEVSPDSTRVSARPRTAPTGWIHLNHPFWRVWLLGETNVFMAHGGTEPVPVPAGRYRILRYEEWPTADWRKPHESLMLGELRTGVDAEPPVTIAAGQTASVAIGSPIIARLTATPQGERVLFETRETDVAGRPIADVIAPSGTSWRPNVAVSILDSPGKRVGGLTLSPHGKGEWRVPTGLKGDFTATMEYSGTSFAVETRKTTFTVR